MRAGPGRGGRATWCPRIRCGTPRAPAVAARPVGELVEAAGCDVRDEDESVAGVGLDEFVDGLGHGARGADEVLPAGDLHDELADARASRPRRAPATRWRPRSDRGTSARWPGRGDGVLADDRVDVGQRAVRVVGGQVAVPQLLDELDRRLRRLTCCRRTSWAFSRASASVSPSTNVAAGRISSWSWRRPYAGEAALDVGVEGLAVLQRAVPAEDRVRSGGGELAARRRSRRPGRSPGGPGGCGAR